MLATQGEGMSRLALNHIAGSSDAAREVMEQQLKSGQAPWGAGEG